MCQGKGKGHGSARLVAKASVNKLDDKSEYVVSTSLSCGYMVSLI